MISRRQWLSLTAAAGGAAMIPPRLLQALQQGRMIQRAIPSSGEMLPVVGLGSSATFSQVARREDNDALREVLRALVENGGKLFDTAPGYGASEQVAGAMAAELGLTNRIFWATKVNVARGGTAADPAQARAQIEQSFQRLRTQRIDCIQVHNLGDPPTQIGILKELKQQGRVRYIGITTTSEDRYGELATIMRNEPLDFIGVDYAADNREAEQVILPLAAERRIGVLVYAPFGRTRLFRRVQGRELPPWAAEIDATSWAQVFLKWIIGHPAVTVVTPATSQARNMIDNLGGGVGRIPTEAQRRQIVEFVDALPQATGGD